MLQILLETGKCSLLGLGNMSISKTYKRDKNCVINQKKWSVVPPSPVYSILDLCHLSPIQFPLLKCSLFFFCLYNHDNKFCNSDKCLQSITISRKLECRTFYMSLFLFNLVLSRHCILTNPYYNESEFYITLRICIQTTSSERETKLFAWGNLISMKVCYSVQIILSSLLVEEHFKTKIK